MHDGCNCYFSFWAIFCPFTHLTVQKMKKKKHLEISSFHASVLKIMIISYTVPEMTHVIFVFHFPLLTTQKNKILKKWKNIWRYHFKLVQQKLDQMMYAYSDMECCRHTFCHFRPVFALLPHYWPQKLKSGKNEKKHLEILSF